MRLSVWTCPCLFLVEDDVLLILLKRFLIGQRVKTLLLLVLLVKEEEEGEKVPSLLVLWLLLFARLGTGGKKKENPQVRSDESKGRGERERKPLFQPWERKIRRRASFVTPPNFLHTPSPLLSSPCHDTIRYDGTNTKNAYKNCTYSCYYFLLSLKFLLKRRTNLRPPRIQFPSLCSRSISSRGQSSSHIPPFPSLPYLTIWYTQVSSYGDIARFLSRPQNSRLVGSALKVLPRSFSSPYLPQVPLPPTNNDDNAQGNSETDEPLPPPLPNPNFVPWHRILSSTGVISPRGNEMSVRRQREWLEAEGVEVEVGPRGGAGGGGGNGGNGQGGTVDAFGLGGAGGGNGGGGGRVRIALYRWEGPE